MVSTMTNVEQVKIPEGYKQTEVGVIPEDWHWKLLGQICTKIQDGNYGESYPKSGEFVEFGVPFLTSKVLGKTGKIKEEKIDFITTEKHELLAKAHLELNDVLFTNRGASVGAIGFADDRVSNGNIGPQLTLLRADSEFLISKYLFHVMKSSSVRKQILNQDSGSAMNFFGIGDTEKFKILFPPCIKEQTAIANALSDVDNLIASLETLIAKKSAIKTAAMQQLLTGKKRLPGFLVESAKESAKERVKESEKQAETQIQAQAVKQKSDQPADSAAMANASQIKTAQHQHASIQGQPNQSHAQTAPRPGYKQTELGEIPEDWEVVGLGYLFEDTVVRKRISGQDEVTFIGMQDVSESAKISSTHKVKYADVKSGFTYFERNDVLVAKITPCFENGKGAFTDVLETEIGFGSTEFHVLRATKNTDSKYLYYFTNTEKFRKELEGEMVGSAGHRRVPLSSIQNYPVAIAKTKKEQTAIANVLSDMDAELDALQQRLSKTKTIKQGMMQELLTGKTRLV